MDESSKSDSVRDHDGPRALTPAAQRALAEAEQRRSAETANKNKETPEIGGPSGPEPVRYGDWEKGGIAWDF